MTSDGLPLGATNGFAPLVETPTNLEAPRAVLFDWDNTLVDTWPVIHASLRDVFTAMGHRPWSLQEVRDNVRHSMRDSFPVLFGTRWEEARDIFYAAFERRHLEALAPLRDAETLLAGLAARGVPLGVVSNKTGRFLRAEVEHLGWGGYFGALVGAGDAARDKPALDALTHALRAMDIEHEHESSRRGLWFVGDSNVDMEIAHAAGCLPVLVRPDGGPEGEFATHGPGLHVPDCTALGHLVFRL